MKAIPFNEDGVECTPTDAAHIRICLPGPTGELYLPVMTRGSREGTGNWTWNGNSERPTLRPSLLTKLGRGSTICHCWVTNGQAQFLDDCTHELKGRTVDLLDSPTLATTDSSASDF